MGKNKGKGQKMKNVFRIASKNLKAKNKAKPVTTNLKKINIVKEENVRTVNKTFIDIQKELAHFSKRLSLEPLPNHLISQCSEGETISVDEATRLMAQL
ncbi:ribosomal biogenesis factor [Petaurus breviceps papuanus]|uniref:ribosomal biogenesis factor n=1 Tax=Petaurus breviceps papuanus TaxID=3040969 RepID=UPI0036DBDC68